MQKIKSKNVCHVLDRSIMDERGGTNSEIKIHSKGNGKDRLDICQDYLPAYKAFRRFQDALWFRGQTLYY